tara:strand:+ start:58 stop:543 length:486 start_codon:yes stop_codon:yes gene_type:complete
MKKLFLLLFLAAPSANADLTHSITSSAQLQVNAAVTQAERIGSSFSISGTGVDVTDGTTAGTMSAGTITSGVYSPGTIAATQNATSGESFSFSQAYTQADAVPTSAPSVGAVGNFSDVTSHASGTAGSLAGSVTSAGVVSLTPGSGGTVATGSVVSSVTVK